MSSAVSRPLCAGDSPSRRSRRNLERDILRAVASAHATGIFSVDGPPPGARMPYRLQSAQVIRTLRHSRRRAAMRSMLRCGRARVNFATEFLLHPLARQPGVSMSPMSRDSCPPAPDSAAHGAATSIGPAVRRIGARCDHAVKRPWRGTVTRSHTIKTITSFFRLLETSSADHNAPPDEAGEYALSLEGVPMSSASCCTLRHASCVSTSSQMPGTYSSATCECPDFDLRWAASDDRIRDCAPQYC